MCKALFMKNLKAHWKLILAFALMHPIKGGVVAWQWAMRMHGFDPKGAMGYAIEKLGMRGTFVAQPAMANWVQSRPMRPAANDQDFLRITSPRNSL